MSAFENAARVFHACESSEGWEACRPFADPGATFEAQAGPLSDLETVEQYAEWMANDVPKWMPDGRYDLHASAWDEERGVALFFATFHGTHAGDGGPVPPTHQQMNTDYVFAVFTNGEGRVERMTKVWNAHWAMQQLGWV